MTTLPNVPGVIRWNLGFSLGASLKGGSRFFTSYTGGPPATSDIVAMAGTIQAAWSAHLNSFMSNDYDLSLIEGTDLTSPSSAQGSVSISVNGGAANHPPDVEACSLINHHINRRYRGGKPRIYLPLGTTASIDTDDTSWTATYVTNLNAAWAAFMAAVLLASSGGTALNEHVNVSYYSGYNTPTILPSGRAKQSAKVRTASIAPDVIHSSTTQKLIASQRRRRVSTAF